MTINSNPNPNTTAHEHAGHKRPLASLERSYSTVTIMASEPSSHCWHKLPAITLSPHTSLALGGLAGAAMATAAVSPIVAVVDLGIVRAQADKSAGGLFGALRLTMRDLWAGRLAYGRPLGLLTFVYGGTYLIANETQVACQQMGVDHKVPTAVAASSFNIAAIAYKDHCFYKMFNKGTAKVFPLKSYGLFAVRDFLTIASSFALKEQLQEYLESAHGISHRNADLTASFAVPIAAQLLSSPLHIWAMDLPTRPTASAWSRLATVASSYTSVLSGRVLRILPAFGLGTYINDVVKEIFYAHNGLEYVK